MMALEKMLELSVSRRGRYLDVDADHRILRSASLSTLDCRWLAPIAAVIMECRTYFGAQLHSIYVSGSVASGDAVVAESDLDMYALVESIDARGREWAAGTSREIERRHPAANPLQLSCLSRPCVADNRELQQIFKLFAVCVHGQDIAVQFPPVVLDASLAWRAATLVYDVTDAIAHLMCATNATRRQMLCRWVMKRVLRAAFTLVAQREHRYTMALVPCYESFCRYYPQHREAMSRVLCLATSPGSDTGEALVVLKHVLTWMPDEASRVFGRAALEAVAAETFRKKRQRDAVSLGRA